MAFWIHVTPRARRLLVGGCHGGALRVAVPAPPVQGRANAACSRALAEALGVPAGAVGLAASSRGCRKRVRVAGDREGLLRRLRQLTGEVSS